MLKMMFLFLLLIAGLPSLHCGLVKNTFSALQDVFDNSNCSISSSIIETKFKSGVDNSHLNAFLVPLEECTHVPDTPQLTEPYKLCKEVSRALYNISTCNKNNLDKILDNETNFSIKSSADALCTEFQKLNIISRNDSDCLSCFFYNKMVCKVICQRNLMQVCDILLWAYKVQNALVEVNMDTNNSGSLAKVAKSSVEKPSISGGNTDPNFEDKGSKNKEITEDIANGAELASSKQTPSFSNSGNLLNQNSDGSYSKVHDVNNDLAEHDKTGNEADTKNVEKNPEVKTSDSPSSTNNIERKVSSSTSQSSNPLTHEGSSSTKNVQTEKNQSKHQDEDIKQSEQQHDAAVAENPETELGHPLNEGQPKDTPSYSIPQNIDNTEKIDFEDYDNTHAKQKLIEQKVLNPDKKKVKLTNVISNIKVEVNKEVVTSAVNETLAVSVVTKPLVLTESPQPSQSPSLDGDQFVNIASHDELLPSEGEEPADTNSFNDHKGISDNVKPGSDEYDLPLDEESEVQKDKIEKPASKYSEDTFHSGKGGINVQEDKNFLFYFLSIVMIVMICYLVFHNKQKIIALIVEGCHERRRRPHGVNYRKLEAK